MKLAQAAQWASLSSDSLRPIPNRTRSAISLARELFAEAEDRGEPFLYQTPASWAHKWLPSKKFKLMRIPLNAAALPCEPKGPGLVLKKIYAREDKPIIVDGNQRGVGSTLHGFTPNIIVIDGKHRFKAATLRGDSHIMAWVGEEAVPQMHAFSGGGGGPSPAYTTPAPGAKLVAKGGDVKKIVADYDSACKKGYKPKMHAVHPPGCEDAVHGLKKKFGDSAQTYKVAWWMHENGRCGGK